MSTQLSHFVSFSPTSASSSEHLVYTAASPVTLILRKVDVSGRTSTSSATHQPLNLAIIKTSGSPGTLINPNQSVGAYTFYDDPDNLIFPLNFTAMDANSGTGPGSYNGSFSYINNAIVELDTSDKIYLLATNGDSNGFVGYAEMQWEVK
jgi:hypothetical protein